MRLRLVAVLVIVLRALGSASLVAQENGRGAGNADGHGPADWIRIEVPADLITNHIFLSANLLPALPPDPTLPVCQDVGVCLLAANALPDAMLADLDVVEQYGVKLYEIFVNEDAMTRERGLRRSDGKMLWAVAAPAGYDPAAAAHARWPWMLTLEKSDPIRCWHEAVFDPARVTSRVLLLPEEERDAYEEGLAAEALAAQASRESLREMLAEDASDAFLIVGIVVSNETVTLSLQRPLDFTNRVDIFGREGPPAPYPWQLLATTAPTTSRIEEVSFVWTNSPGFFRAGDADSDSDGDGLPDARESWLYGTEPASADTDADGLPDGWEVGHGLDPRTADALADPDGDRVPNIYEYHHATNPTNADNHLIARLRVDPGAAATNAALFASIDAAFAASAPYAIIEIADGHYSGPANAGIWFPAHPILLMTENWGASRLAVVNYDAVYAAFYFNDLQDNRTIIRGLTLCLGGATGYQIGFWLGSGAIIAPDMGAAPRFEGVTVELGASDVNVAFFCRHAAPQAVRFENCVIRGKRGAIKPLRGIYAIDSPSLCLFNCSFLNFSSNTFSYGIQFESTYGNYGSAADPTDVNIVNCVWDESFAHANVEAFVRLERSIVYNVSLTNSLAPRALDWFPPDSQCNLLVTNAYLAIGGHLRSGSPGVNAGVDSAPWLDFEGQARDTLPDLGADEYAGFAAGDSDGDGVADSAEVETYATNPYDADSDNDGLDDGVEVAMGSDPTNPFNFRVSVLGSVTNRTGSTAPMRACFGWMATLWNAATATNVAAPGDFELDVLAEQVYSGAWVNVTCDFNSNGLVDAATEPVYSQSVMTTGATYRLRFDLRDYDGDGVPDWDEVSCGTAPCCATNYCVTIRGTITNLSPTAGCFRVGCSFTANGTAMLAITNVAADGAFLLPHVEVRAAEALRVHLYDDSNSNAVLDAEEAFATQLLSITGAVSTITFDGALAYCDKDSDGITDFWEARHGLSWTNGLDACENPDGDGLINLHESWCQTDPWTADGANYALSDATLAIDSRIAGRNPTNALPIFENYLANGANGVFIRNTNCWAADIDLTCCSPWNSYAGNLMAGTLISPRHVLFAAHYDQIPTNSTLTFVDRQNNVITRTLVAKKRHPDCPPNGTYPDFTVGLLDSDVPTNQISFARVLPLDYIQQVRNGLRLPSIRLDQEEKALIGDLRYVNQQIGGQSRTACLPPVATARLSMFEDVVNFDSGNPAFIVLDGQAILLTVWTLPLAGSGTSVSAFRSGINQLMADLGGGYQLNEVDMSFFSLLP